MTFGKHLLRGAALSALAVGLSTTASAQDNGSNFQVFSNNLDVIYGGLGAGGTQTAADGLGTWFNGEDLKGGTMSTVTGDWAYKQIGWRESACVLGPNPPVGGGAVGGLAILWPNIATVELDGTNGHANAVFSVPFCAPGGTPSFVPYGTPAGSSFNFLLSGYPSGAGLGTSLTLLLPNEGLVPSSNGGTATLIANTGLAGLFINSTGFCWIVDFNWLPSALVSLDDVNGWWHYMHNSPDNNQYWGMSNDEMQIWQSQSIALDGGTGLIGFLGQLDYEFHSKQVDPSSMAALQPAGSNGTGVYYSTTVDAGGGNPAAPGTGIGFDLGRHSGWSQAGTGGVTNGLTGLGNQDPAGSPIAPQIPSVGFATWNNENYNALAAPTGGFRLTWITIDWDASFLVDPALAGEATKWFGTSRIPSTIPAAAPVPWPQSYITVPFFPFLVHNTVNHDGSGIWPDPNGFPSGTFGVPGVSGTSIHLPIILGSACIGVPLALQHGTSGLAGPGGPLVWSPNGVPGFPTLGNSVSSTAQLHYID
jgi:hypothetical protein